MRTLWLTNDLPPRAGGIQQYLQNLLVRGYPEQSVVIGPAEPGSEAHDAAQPYRVVRAPGAITPRRSVLQLVREVAREHRPDVVVLGASWPLGHLGPWLARDPGVPILAFSYGLEAGLAHAHLGGLVQAASRSLTAVTTLSDYSLRELQPYLRSPIVRALPGGVDAKLFHPSVDGAPMRERWGVPAGAPLVGCISRLVPRKGQDRILDAWPAISAAHPEAWLVLVGTGPLLGELRARAADLHNVVVTGEVAWADLPASYAALDLFVMPCRTRLGGTDVEGLGIVYLEAQAVACVAVAGTSGGAPEAVQEGITGHVVDGDDPEAIAGIVIGLLDDPERRREMGRAGRTWVERDWTWDGVGQRFRDLLTEVASTT